MLTVAQALDEISQRVATSPPQLVSLDEALGRVLAEPVVSTIDSPPFDKALMDGFAVRSHDLVDGAGRLEVVEEVTAGRIASASISCGQAIQIMTGAPIPDGADAVVRVEDTQVDTEDDATWVQIQSSPVKAGQDMIKRGTSMTSGDVVLEAGRRVGPPEMGLLAELGQHQLSVTSQVTVGILATGDELVTIDQEPGPGQIRNSNETMLSAQARSCGALVRTLGIARDTPDHLAEKIAEGLSCDVLLLSGGVSAGRLDLVPSQLEAAGVKEIFHKVQIKPGKPLWFGTAPGTLVFGLPGNPVSSMVCFELFVRTALERLSGLAHAGPRPVRAKLGVAFSTRGNRPTYYPAQLVDDLDGPRITPVNWHGSSDLRSTADANAMIHFPAGDLGYEAGDLVDAYRWSGQY